MRHCGCWSCAQAKAGACCCPSPLQGHDYSRSPPVTPCRDPHSLQPLKQGEGRREGPESGRSSFPVPKGNSMAKRRCQRSPVVLRLPVSVKITTVRRQPRQGVWGGVKDYTAILLRCWHSEMCLETNMIYWPALKWCTTHLMLSPCTNLLLSLGMREDGWPLTMLLPICVCCKTAAFSRPA